MRSRAAAGWVLAVAVFGVSWGSILVRLCDARAPAIAFWRVAFATVLVAPFALRDRPARPADRRAVRAGVLAGVFLAVHFAAWIQSLAWTSVASSVILVSTAPVFTAAAGPWLLGERPGRRAWIAVGLALAGSAVLAGGDIGLGAQALAGDLLAVLGAVAVSGYLMVGRRLRERMAFAPYLGLVYGSASVALAGFAALAGAPLTGWPAPTWFWLILMAAGPNLLGHGLLNWSVRRLRALTVQTAVLGEPILATVYAAVLLGETPRPAFYPGAALIAIGVALAAREEAPGGSGEGERTGA